MSETTVSTDSFDRRSCEVAEPPAAAIDPAPVFDLDTERHREWDGTWPVRKREAGTCGDAVAMQLQALGIDRARLAAELDSAAAHARKLEDSNREVARRIDVAMDTIQKLLDEHDR